MFPKYVFTFLSSALHTVFGGWMPVCRFTPSCSQYASEAVEKHGWIRGSVLAAKRISRCRPGASWGTDPVPAIGGTEVSRSHK